MTTPVFSADDYHYMAQAIRLARKGRYTATPNPTVGCVLVAPAAPVPLVAEGWHRIAGQGHAEVNALADARQKGLTLNEATAYVTLEPCSHTGKTPPCADALVKAGVQRVVYGMQDPNPSVSGRGIQRIRDAGIAVDGPLLEADCQALNPGFNKRMRTGLARVTAKVATSLDGRTAMRSGESQWITGSQARADVQKLRASSCAIVTGAGTVLADDPALTVRDPSLALPGQTPRQPLRVIVDSNLRIPVDARILQQPGNALVVYAKADAAQVKALAAAGIETLQLANTDGKVDLAALLAELGKRQMNEIMLESGAKLLGAFIQAQLVDDIIWYMATALLGSDARPAAALPFTDMKEQIRLDLVETRRVGADMRWHVRPRYTIAE